MRVLVTGARGQLGSALMRALEGHELIPASRPEFDLSSYSSVAHTVESAKPDVIIHAAAHTDVDGCERDPDLAYAINALGTQNVALTCHQVGAALVAVGTDYVFDGEKGEPYLEFDQTNPISVYGRSKLAGEALALTLHDRVYVVRTSWVYGAPTRNFVATMLRLSETRRELSVVADERGSPTYAPDLAEAIGRLIETDRFGVYHFVNEGGCSRFELASEAIRLAGRDTAVRPVTAAEYQRSNPLPARRPRDSRLRNFAGDRALGIRLRPWQEALAEHVRAPVRI